MNLLRMALSVMRFPPPSNPSEVGIDFAPEKNLGEAFGGWIQGVVESFSLGSCATE